MTHQEPQKREPTSGLHLQRTQRDIMGPILVDQTLRQAIMHCWMMLPDDQRTPENVEKEMTRLLKRALDNLREDAASFGFTNDPA
ncbi:MAG: hypothetical protein H6657_29290 [Ardenticatenaceae bacterium]|nr:hypothetical protein [Ardenticatenaceae bacterium]